jgi:hypothetical protein
MVSGNWLILTAATGYFHALRLRTDDPEDLAHDSKSLRSSFLCTTFVHLQVSPLIHVNYSRHDDIEDNLL